MATIVPSEAMIVAMKAAEAVMKMAIAMEAVAIMEEMVVAEAMETVMEPEAVEIKRPVVRRIPVVVVVPGPGADEYSIHKIVRAPVTIRRAGVGIVRIESVFAHRRRVVKTVTRPDLYADGNLCLGIGSGQSQKSQQSEILQVSHHWTPFRAPDILAIFRPGSF